MPFCSSTRYLCRQSTCSPSPRSGQRASARARQNVLRFSRSEVAHAWETQHMVVSPCAHSPPRMFTCTLQAHSRPLGAGWLGVPVPHPGRGAPNRANAGGPKRPAWRAAAQQGPQQLSHGAVPRGRHLPREGQPTRPWLCATARLGRWGQKKTTRLKLARRRAAGDGSSLSPRAWLVLLPRSCASSSRLLGLRSTGRVVVAGVKRTEYEGVAVKCNENESWIQARGAPASGPYTSTPHAAAIQYACRGVSASAPEPDPEPHPRLCPHVAPRTERGQ